MRCYMKYCIYHKGNKNRCKRVRFARINGYGFCERCEIRKIPFLRGEAEEALQWRAACVQGLMAMVAITQEVEEDKAK